MATEAQINANRQNAEKSTGPRTAEGKAAVAQNALKHGLLASPTVINGEDQAAFDLYRQAMLAEMGPVGMMESSLAERVASLTWRLRRAERMQDQALKMQISSDRLDLVVRQVQWSYREAKGLPQEESQPKDDHMTLGRAARNDIANYRVLGRLLLYERRIESSFYKATKELNRLQSARKAEQARAAEQQTAQESPPARRHKGDLKKQTQFAATRTSAKLSVIKAYDDTTPAAARENKANQTQFQDATAPRRGGSIRCSSKVQGRLALG